MRSPLARIGATTAVALVTGLTVLATAGPAAAINVSGGCRLVAASRDSSGRVLQAITALQGGAGQPSGTKGDPIIVDHDGQVQYVATAPLVTNNHFEIKIYSIPVKSENHTNGTRQTRKSGVEKMKDYFKVNQPGLYYVSGSYTGTGGSCSGHAWVKVLGSPVGSPLWIAGVVFAAVGGVLVVTAWPRRRSVGLS